MSENLFMINLGVLLLGLPLAIYLQARSCLTLWKKDQHFMDVTWATIIATSAIAAAPIAAGVLSMVLSS